MINPRKRMPSRERKGEKKERRHQAKGNTKGEGERTYVQ
jgi:hypothetical protein